MTNLIMASLTMEEFKMMISTCIREELDKTKLAEHSAEKKEDELLSRDQASKILKISKVTLYKYVKSGKVKAHRINRKVYFKKEELYASIRKIDYKIEKV